MGALIWWVLVLGSAYQAMRAWGPPAAVAVVLGLYGVAWLVPWIGGLATGVGAIAIGARAEDEIQRKIPASS
jgi:hypothetical protein